MLHESENISYKADHAFHWASQCVDALAYIHWKGFAHGDLKTAKYDLLFVYTVRSSFGIVAPSCQSLISIFFDKMRHCLLARVLKSCQTLVDYF